MALYITRKPEIAELKTKGMIVLIMKKRILKTEEVDGIICDICNREVEQYTRCDICGKDICGKCLISTDDDLSPNSWEGDYPSHHICKPCWEKGKSLIEKQKQMEREFEAIEEQFWNKFDLWKEWKDAAERKKVYCPDCVHWQVNHRLGWSCEWSRKNLDNYCDSFWDKKGKNEKK